MLLVGYWPREKLLLHAQHLAQQKCRGLQAGQDCGLLHPSLVHLFVGIVLITIFGLFYFFSFGLCHPSLSSSVRVPVLDHYVWSFCLVIFLFFLCCVWFYFCLVLRLLLLMCSLMSSCCSCSTFLWCVSSLTRSVFACC